MKNQRSRLVVAILALSVGACASPSLQQADTYFSSRSYRQAIRAYEIYLHGRPDAEELDRVLFQLAVAHTLAEPPRPATGEAEEHLERLVNDFPDSPYTPPARLMLDLQDHLAALRHDLDTRTELLERLLAESAHLEESLQRLAVEKDSEIDRLAAQLAVLKQKLERRTAEIAAREEKIARLERELRALKRIDTGGADP